MKKNKMERQSGGHGALLIVAFVLIAAAAGAAAFAYTTLRDVCREQCVINDVSMQVDIHDGKLVKGDVVADALGLRNGANLAEIDFSKRCINSIEEFTLTCVQSGLDPSEYFKAHQEDWKDSILICEDIFCGVVPMGAEMRAWRQATGRLCQYLSREAAEVSRIFCGLEQKLK